MITKIVLVSLTVTAVIANPLERERVKRDQGFARNHTASWITSGKFQGDIAGHDQTSFNQLIQTLNDWSNPKNESGGSVRSAVSDPRINVPYIIDSSDPLVTKIVSEAIAAFHASTCVRFVKRTSEPNYLKITDQGEDGDCSSFMGNIKVGAQKVSLVGRGCKSTGTAIHELMHAIGFWHEQQRIDRDKFIEVFYDNVIPNRKGQYEVAPTNKMNLIGNYDEKSVMHYPSWGFAKGAGLKTMRNKITGSTEFGGEILTPEDIRKINILYGCRHNPGIENIEALNVQGVSYYLREPGTNYCLNVPLASSDDGVQLRRLECNKTPAQRFIFIKLVGGGYIIRNVELKGQDGNFKYLRVSSETKNEPGKVVQQGYPGPFPPETAFNAEPREGAFHITSKFNNRIIWFDTAGNLFDWRNDGGQNWILEKA